MGGLEEGDGGIFVGHAGVVAAEGEGVGGEAVGFDVAAGPVVLGDDGAAGFDPGEEGGEVGGEVFAGVEGADADHPKDS